MSIDKLLLLEIKTFVDIAMVMVLNSF